MAQQGIKPFCLDSKQKSDNFKIQLRAVQRSEFLGGPSLTDLQNTGGARLGASIDFLKNWGGRGPPGPPGSYGPALGNYFPQVS